jgi:hypothetical protein
MHQRWLQPRGANSTKLTMRKLLLFLFALGLGLIFIFFVRSITKYELNTDRLNNEIPTVDCYFDRDEDELFIKIVECHWYGRDNCKGQKVVEGTLKIIPYLTETSDTLKFIEKKEGSFKYRCPNWNNDCWADELKISLTYKVDSLNTVYDKKLLLTPIRDKEYNFGFSAH